MIYNRIANLIREEKILSTPSQKDIAIVIKGLEELLTNVVECEIVQAVAEKTHLA